MNQIAVNTKVAELKAAGMEAREIRRVLFNTKGVRVSQIKKALGE